MADNIIGGDGAALWNNYLGGIETTADTEIMDVDGTRDLQIKLDSMTKQLECNKKKLKAANTINKENAAQIAALETMRNDLLDNVREKEGIIAEMNCHTSGLQALLDDKVERIDRLEQQNRDMNAGAPLCCTTNAQLLSTIRDKDNQYSKLVAKLLLPTSFGIVGEEVASLPGDLGDHKLENTVAESLNNTTISRQSAEQEPDDLSFASNEVGLVSSVNASFASEAFTPSRQFLKRISRRFAESKATTDATADNGSYAQTTSLAPDFDRSLTDHVAVVLNDVTSADETTASPKINLHLSSTRRTHLKSLVNENKSYLEQSHLFFKTAKEYMLELHAAHGTEVNVDNKISQWFINNKRSYGRRKRASDILREGNSDEEDDSTMKAQPAFVRRIAAEQRRSVRRGRSATQDK